MATDDTMTLSAGLAGRYAAALYAQAEASGLLDETVAQMFSLGQMIGESAEFRRVLDSPLYDIAQARRAVLAVLGSAGYSTLVQNFVGVVVNNRRLRVLAAMVDTFAALVAARRGQISAQVATATALSPVQREQLRARLTEAGYSNVALLEQIDPSLLGGMVLRIGARLYDTSLKSRLQRLQFAMKGAA